MPSGCVPCIGLVIKRAIDERNHSPEMQAVLESIEDCPDQWEMVMCPCTPGAGRGKGDKGDKPKRPPSAYNLHIGSCMKSDEVKALPEAPLRMKECARQWREMKKQQ